MRHNVRDEKGRFCKKEATVTKGYKGFNKGLICLDKKYKVGKTYKEYGVSICRAGMMHFCESPLDVLNFYPVINPNTSTLNEFAEVEAIGWVIKEFNKSATNNLRIVKKLSLGELIEAAATVGNYSKSATLEHYSNAAVAGNCSRATTTGYNSNAATKGYESHAATAGNDSHAVTAGNSSNATTAGNNSYATTTDDFSSATTAGKSSNATTAGNHSNAVASGKFSTAATLGHLSNATTTGVYSRATTVGIRSNAATVGESSAAIASGKFSIAAALGAHSKARAALGNWIVLAEYDSENKPLLVKAAKVDGKKIKANTFYKLENGEFVEA